MADKILVEKRSHVLLMGLNRPDKLNAFDVEMIRQLANAYTRLGKDKQLRCGVLYANGTDFTAGLDLGAFVKHLPYELFRPAIPRFGVDPWGVQRKPCPKPIVSAVHGRCYTLGIELVLCGQVVIAAQDARFIQYEVGRGLMPFGGGNTRWPAAVGEQNAYRYLLTGDELGAQEALRIGLVQEVVHYEQCLPKAIEIAERIARQAPLGVQAALRNARLGQAKGQRAALRRTRREIIKLFLSKDLRRGVKAFQAREEAEFKGD